MPPSRVHAFQKNSYSWLLKWNIVFKILLQYKILGWPKSSFGFFHKILLKTEQTFWPNQHSLWGFSGDSRIKNPPAMQETQIWSLGWEDPLEKEMAIHSVFLLGKSHGQRSLVSYSSWGCKESDMTGHTHTIWLFWFHNKGSYCLVLLCMFLPRLKLIHLISLNVCNFLWFCQMMFLSMQLFLILWI